jgi:alkylhydroperoxidase family enzyme
MSARIKIVSPQEADGKLKELYDKFQNRMANILAVQSLHPESLEAHLNYYRSIMFGRSPLPRSTREMIATVVSAVNNCHY